MQNFHTKALKHKYWHKLKQVFNFPMQMNEWTDVMTLETPSVGYSYDG